MTRRPSESRPSTEKGETLAQRLDRWMRMALLNQPSDADNLGDADRLCPSCDEPMTITSAETVRCLSCNIVEKK